VFVRSTQIGRILEMFCVYQEHTNWKDTRDDVCLSAAHKMTTTNVEVCCKDGVKTKSKPDAILDYNLNKTGVNRNDQMISYYPMKMKQLKWWKKLFFHMFVMAIVNAYILYRETRNENQKQNCNLASFVMKISSRCR
jgi:hypothetical protein